MKPWAWWFWIGWMLAASLGMSAADLSVQGSDTMVLLAQRWATAYMGSHPGLRI